MFNDDSYFHINLLNNDDEPVEGYLFPIAENTINFENNQLDQGNLFLNISFELAQNYNINFIENLNQNNQTNSLLINSQHVHNINAPANHPQISSLQSKENPSGKILIDMESESKMSSSEDHENKIANLNKINKNESIRKRIKVRIFKQIMMKLDNITKRHYGDYWKKYKFKRLSQEFIEKAGIRINKKWNKHSLESLFSENFEKDLNNSDTIINRKLMESSKSITSITNFLGNNLEDVITNYVSTKCFDGVLTKISDREGLDYALKF